MKKYLVDVYLPAIGQHYDAYLPAERRVHEVTQLLVEIAEKLSDGAFAGTADTMLLDAFSGEILRSGDESHLDEDVEATYFRDVLARGREA